MSATRDGRGRRWLARPGPAVGALAAVLTGLAGCSGAASRASPSIAGTASEAGGSAGGRPAASADPAPGTKALTASATSVHAQVEALAAAVQPRIVSREVTVDEAAPCTVGGSGAWPRRWGYVVRLALDTPDATLSARTASERLRGQGWAIHPTEVSANVLDFDARKGAMLLRVSGEPNPSSLVVEGYGGCVGVDGSLQRG